MPIYTAPNMSFLDSYVNAAKYRDERTDRKNQQLMEGVTNLVKGGAEAYKWQERKDILDKAGELDRREKEILAEIERLKAEKNEKAVPTMDSVMAATGWKGIPFPLDAKAEKQEDEFVAPVGLGIYKRGMF